MSARIITRLMHEVEVRDHEIGRLTIALRGYDIEPQSPFSLLSSEEVLKILHPHDRRAQRCQGRR